MSLHQRYRCQTRSDLRAEIHYLERRLAEMGQAGDCAYERALAQAFAGLLKQRRQLLVQTEDDG